MSRPIKFRAWDKINQRMSEPFNFDDENITFDNSSSYYSVRGAGSLDIEVMQFTGLHDKNGKEIYEGDVIGAPTARGLIEDISTFRWLWMQDENGDLHKPIDQLHWLKEMVGFEKAEVIGNIHENPELLS